ncbi:hypothetical protein [Humidesulfovibrio idahonensis]
MGRPKAPHYSQWPPNRNSGSLGYGSGSSSSSWVNRQTSIIGTNSVDVRTEKNTAVEGAVIAAENGKLKLDTDTLTDIVTPLTKRLRSSIPRPLAALHFFVYTETKSR